MKTPEEIYHIPPHTDDPVLYVRGDIVAELDGKLAGRDREIKHLKQENAQLKAIINDINLRIPLTPNAAGGCYMVMFGQSDIDQLRQKERVKK